MKNASLVGLIGAIVLAFLTLVMWIVPYGPVYVISKIIGAAAFLCIGYFFLKMYRVYQGK